MSFETFLASRTNFFAANLQYLPIAFNLYKDKVTEHKFIQILDLSRIDEGIVMENSFHQYPAAEFVEPLSNFIQKQELFKDEDNNIVRMTFSLPDGLNEEIKIKTQDINKLFPNTINLPDKNLEIIESDEFKNLLLRTRGIK